MSGEDIKRLPAKRNWDDVEVLQKWIRAFVVKASSKPLDVLNLLENGYHIHKCHGVTTLMSDHAPHTVNLTKKMFQCLRLHGFIKMTTRDKLSTRYELIRTPEYESFRKLIVEYENELAKKVGRFLEKNQAAVNSYNRGVRRERRKLKKIKNNPDKIHY